MRFAAEGEMDTSYAAWRLRTPLPYSIVAVTKVDIPEALAAGEKFAKTLAKRKKPLKVHLISSATGAGLDPLLDAVGKVLFSKGAPNREEGRGRRLGKPRQKK